MIRAKSRNFSRFVMSHVRSKYNTKKTIYDVRMFCIRPLVFVPFPKYIGKKVENLCIWI